MAELLGAESILFKSSPKRDAYGDPIPGTGTETQVDGCAVYPASATEDAFRSGKVTNEYIALLPAGTRVSSTSTATWDGETFNVETAGQKWKYLEGDEAGVQITLRRGA